MTTRPLRLATRGSPLALWQAQRVARLLEAHGVSTSLVVVETDGDRRVDVPIEQLGGQGIFVKEVQAAVVRGDADAAVHSAKDLPAAVGLSAPGLRLVAFPERADPRDVLVGGRLSTLPTGSMVATGSARRRAQLANLRSDLVFTGLRGNLATRLAAAGVGEVVAVVVAKAAIDRLEWSPPEGVETEVLDADTMLPQVGQGALAVECREDDSTAGAALAAIDDASLRPLVEAERAFLAELGGGCTLPVGAHARWVSDREGDQLPTMVLAGLMASADGQVVIRHHQSGEDAARLGEAVARFLVDEAGGSDLGGWPPPGDGGVHPASARPW